MASDAFSFKEPLFHRVDRFIHERTVLGCPPKRICIHWSDVSKSTPTEYNGLPVFVIIGNSTHEPLPLLDGGQIRMPKEEIR